MSRHPEAQNQLVSFAEIPDGPPMPDVGINIQVAPPQAEADEPVILSASYNADGALLLRCQPDLGTCIQIQVVEDSDKPERFDHVLPLQLKLDDIRPPSPGAYGPYYREGGQFQLDIRVFFELPGGPARYSVSASVGRYRTDPVPFEILR